jgi:hypothetical protein
MSMKSWVLHRVHNIGAVTGRADLPARDSAHGREPGLDPDSGAPTEAGAFAEAKSLDVGHLGVYAPLIGAVRKELERFVHGQIRLHVVIADRDRFVLSAIGVRSPGGEQAREVLLQFMQEFRPEQVKRYLAREVVGRLPNAAVIDLSHFAGLTDLEARDRGGEHDEYAELLAALRIAPQAPLPAPYEVSVLGRWIENDALPAPSQRSPAGDSLTTPLSDRRWEFDIHDRAGARHAVLPAVVPGRRYIVGKGAHCDIRVDGAYTSRRHAELWVEHDRWHVADSGSTNGIRVEATSAGGAASAAVDPTRPAELRAGMRLVLSARADGPPGDYPWIALRAQPRDSATPATPIAVPVASASASAASGPAAPLAAARAAPTTPRTAVLSARAAEPVFELREAREDGIRVHPFRGSELPVSVGRSRGQTLVIDWRHEGVSGHHLDIDTIDEHAAHGTVHGDNGVDIGAEHHAVGARFRWPFGASLVLGGSLPGEPACTLRLERQGEQ